MFINYCGTGIGCSIFKHIFGFLCYMFTNESIFLFQLLKILALQLFLPNYYSEFI